MQTLKLVVLVLCSVLASAQVPSTYFGMHTLNPQTHWPTVSFGAVRPANVSWAAIETSRGVYNWTTLDAWVAAAQAHGVEFDYLFLATPAWAATSSSLPPTNLQDWNDFVTAVVTRYAGRISSYEVWNEPNSTTYWTGTTAQLVDMAHRAYTIIKAIDPAAKVLTPSPTWTNKTAWSWMDSYLAAGGGAYADVIAYHGYTGSTDGSSTTIIDNMATVLTARGVTKPSWMTEGGWGTNTTVPNADAQAAFLAQRYLLYWSRSTHPVARFYWYQWDNTNWGTLWTSGGGVNQAGTAYQQVYNWMLGATATPCAKAGSIWTCGFILASGVRALAVWNVTTTSNYTPAAQYTQYRDLAGAVHPVAGTVSIGNKPVLLFTNPAPIPPPGLTVVVR